MASGHKIWDTVTLLRGLEFAHLSLSESWWSYHVDVTHVGADDDRHPLNHIHKYLALYSLEKHTHLWNMGSLFLLHHSPAGTRLLTGTCQSLSVIFNSLPKFLDCATSTEFKWHVLITAPTKSWKKTDWISSLKQETFQCPYVSGHEFDSLETSKFQSA